MHSTPSVLAALTLALVAGAGTAAAQSDSSDWRRSCERNYGDRERHCEIRTTNLERVRSLDIDPGMYGGLSVTAWERPDVEVETRIQVDGDTEAEAAQRARTMRIHTEGGRLRVTPPPDAGGWSVIFHVKAPRSMNIVGRAHHGPVSINGVNGTMQLEVVNGPISLKDVGGDVRAETVNGPLAVTLGGSRWSGRGLNATAHNGPVTLLIPEGYSAELEAGTVNGPFSVDLPDITVERGRRTRRLSTRLGAGGPPVKVTTINGPAVIRTRGRQLLTL